MDPPPQVAAQTGAVLCGREDGAGGTLSKDPGTHFKAWSDGFPPEDRFSSFLSFQTLSGLAMINSSGGLKSKQQVKSSQVIQASRARLCPGQEDVPPGVHEAGRQGGLQPVGQDPLEQQETRPRRKCHQLHAAEHRTDPESRQLLQSRGQRPRTLAPDHPASRYGPLK